MADDKTLLSWLRTDLAAAIEGAAERMEAVARDLRDLVAITRNDQSS